MSHALTLANPFRSRKAQRVRPSIANWSFAETCPKWIPHGDLELICVSQVPTQETTRLQEAEKGNSTTDKENGYQAEDRNEGVHVS